jgi:2-oxoisovalerate dehydrogenase E1 component alpha subunit
MTPHSSDDDDRAYRPKEEVEQMKANDPLARFQKALLDRGILDQAHVEELEARAQQEVDRSVEAASNAPYPEITTGSHPVYAEDIRRG